MSYTSLKPKEPSFTQTGLRGYQFPTKNKDVEVYFVNVEKGHDNFIKSKKITHMYFVLDGNGHFTIDKKRYDVKPGMFIEVPPHIEYCYSGKMNLILIMSPPWFQGNEEILEKNPDVFGK